MGYDPVLQGHLTSVGLAPKKWWIMTAPWGASHESLGSLAQANVSYFYKQPMKDQAFGIGLGEVDCQMTSHGF